MEVSVHAVMAAKIGFASHQNAVPLLREVKIALAGEQALERCRLSLTADPAFVEPRDWRIDRIAPGDELAIADRAVRLNATLLDGLTESLRGTLTLTLHAEDGTELARERQDVELLAHNEWGGLSSMAELLPAFVMPNDPAVDRLLKVACEVLRRAGKPDALDGYRSKDRARVWQVASAIWSAVAGARLSYAIPPASFERAGQKVRTPGAIMEGGLATCLDTALLFAAALEQAGLNPLVVLTRGHAFTGVWLQPVEFSNLMTDEAAALRRHFDLDDLIVFETTLATHNPPAGFTQAIAAARRQIAEEADGDFAMAIDIRRARMQQIRPLGVVAPPRGAPDAVALDAAGEGFVDAPTLPAVTVEEEEEAPATPTDRVRQWQRKLLNLTTANRLLHVPDRAKMLRLLCPDPGVLEDLLASGRKVRIAPMPDLEAGGRDLALYERQTQASLREEVAAQALERGEALSLLPRDRLDAALVELYRKARTDLEEGGANTLYLALGFLKWKKSVSEENSYRAPLVLLPVRLERKSALSGVVMTAHEDEPRFNMTLLELLRQDFDLTIRGLEEELPADAHGVDLEQIWRIVRSAVRDMPGFEVVPEVMLGTFSFAKYLMWKDLVDRGERLKESPLVRHLIERDGGGDFGSKADFPRAEALDALADPGELFTPLPADSSQLAAVVASARGHSFVLDGPPGCGKSQTIANMIAHNMALGRRVLFVAEKKAALDVVQRRLADKGLGPFCLELHSAKATKAAVLHQLDQAWTTRDALSAGEWEREAAEARRLRGELNDLVQVLHRREDNGWTLHRAIGLVVREGADHVVRLGFAEGARHDGAAMERLRDIARRLGLARSNVADLPADLGGIGMTTWSNGWQEQIVAAAGQIAPALDWVEEAARRLLSATLLPLAADDRMRLGRLAGFVRRLLTMHGHDLRFAFSPSLREQTGAAREALALIARYREEEAGLSAAYAEEAVRRIDVAATRQAWSLASEKFWLLSVLAKRRVTKDLARTSGASGPVDAENDLPRLEAMLGLLDRIDALAPAASALPGWAGLATQADAIEAAIERAERLRAALSAEADGPESLSELRRAVERLVVDANDLLDSDGPVAGALARLEQALADHDAATQDFARLGGIGGAPGFAHWRALAATVIAHAARLRDWANWRRVRDEAIGADLLPLVEALESGMVEPSDTVRAFELAYARWFAIDRMDDEPLLKSFAANEQMDRIARFREVDERMSALASRYIRAKICGLIPDKEEVGRKDGYAVLKRQLQLQRRHKPIRQLATEMGDAFTRLAPCMLMSPLSIAQYLPADQALFDLVIFDEASQITPWDAIGAMARGRQVVIAGDPRQMPPSNDFQRSASAGEDEEGDGIEPDLASILEECLAAGVPQHSLDWHYRSRHESLIAFSNHHYYESRLVTFPASETRSSAVTWRRVDGVWAKGAERTNQAEAKAIVEEAVRRLRDPAFVDAADRPLTLGIITMNVEQMRLVEDLLDRARRRFPDIEPHFAEDRLEPVVVRNLETAQGDERDVILLGVGFGPTEPGGKTMSMNFGKLNAQGGWRRLNVAVTRARREMMLFTSFDPGMIDLSCTSQQAVADLKHFIEYAHKGPRAIAEADRGSVGGAESPFEEAVTLELRKRGWTVVPQVGVSRFRIDLGIVHPDRPGDYLLGIECDGATYHSAATARDRDKVRAAILESLGWRLLRVWSTDWWTNRARAADTLHAAMEALLEEDRALCAEAARQAEAGADAHAHAHADAEEEGDAYPVFDTLPAETGEEMPIARRVEPDGEGAAPPASYRFARFADFGQDIAPDRFYEEAYEPALRAMIAHVLIVEAPVAEHQLVQRIARAHGFQRAGRIIRERVMHLARRHHHVEREGDGAAFVWTDAETAAAGCAARFPASDADIRPIEDIALAELRAGGPGDPVEIARRFGIRRLTRPARERILRALAIA